ncbi:MAG: PSD1 and planctomycete cytochrome C domain-containing protein [Planctomycetota bacterium]
MMAAIMGSLVCFASCFSAASSFADEPGDRVAAAARQVLQTQCVSCHSGPSPRGGLSLTTRETLLEGGESGEVLDLQQPAKSRLLELVTHAAEPGMPFKKAKLPAEQIEILTAWVKAGVPYTSPLDIPAEEQWWSLKPLSKPAVPQVAAEFRSWPQNPVDQFVAAAWTAKQLGPAPVADRRTILRRVYFDLLGLPPTPEEMDEFLADRDPLAYERTVDRLLNDPRYGERWARFWMDLAHYAETHGHDQDRPRPNSWPYRDYLIRSFNQDKPYARFVQEQIAGDALWPNDPDGYVAMGLLAAGPWDESSLKDIQEDTLDRQVARYLDRDDMVTTAMSTFVSSTVHCARCHEHKFDPISQEEYYRLQAVFAGIDKGERPYDPDPAVTQQRQSLQAQLAALPALIAQLDSSLSTAERQAEVATWEERIRSSISPWTILNAESVKSEQGSVLTKQSDGSFVASGPRPEKDVYVLTSLVDLPRVTGLRLEVLLDDSLAHQGPGRQDNGNLHLNELTVTAAPRDNPSAAKPVKLIRPQADFNQQGWSIEMALDGNPGTAWGIYPEVSKPHVAVLEFAEPVAFESGTVLTVRLEQIHGGGHLIGRPRISVTDLSTPLPLSSEVLPSHITDIVKIEPAQRTPAQQVALTGFVVNLRLEQQLAALPAQQFVYAASSSIRPEGGFVPTKTPRMIQVLKRGDIRRPEKEVIPGSMSCIPNLSGELAVTDLVHEQPRRIALAKWLSAPENVLTWRSIVNRVWQRHFGRGLVDTPNDFGRMGSLPTHPELLDWLAVTFRDQGGSFKELDRLLVTSATYRQSSQSHPAFAERDADARYLWRMPRTRLDAECVRDAVLQVTGKLDLKMGGPSVKQFIQTPGIHVTPTVDYLGYDVDHPDNYRRSVYRFIFRTIPDPFMETLDCADASQLTPIRNTSITALQALATLNNRLMVRQSEHLATRLTTEANDLPTQVTRLYQLVLTRPPTERELQAVVQHATQHGLPNACRVLLNCNEFLFVN